MPPPPKQHQKIRKKNTKKKKKKQRKQGSKQHHAKNKTQLRHTENTEKKYKSKRCKARTKKNNRCKKRTKRSQYCHIHLQSIEHLQIKPSKIPNAGLGLFTTQNIIRPRKKRNSFSRPREPLITTYGGKIRNYNPNKPYTVELSGGRYLDGSKPTSSAGRFANNCTKTVKNICKSNNARLVVNNNKDPPTVKMVATRNIYYEKDNKRPNNNQTPPNNEIYLAYGPGYWGKK